MSAGYAGLITALAFAAGVAIQPLARSLERCDGREESGGAVLILAAAAAALAAWTAGCTAVQKRIPARREYQRAKSLV